MKHYLLLVLFLLSFTYCGGDDPISDSGEGTKPPAPGPGDTSSLFDNNLETYYEAKGGNISFVISRSSSEKISAYSFYSANDIVDTDPKTWIVKGSDDNKTWIDIDQQKDIAFCARFQENSYVLKNSIGYKHIKFEIQPNKGDRLRIGELKFHTVDTNKDWSKFVYPSIIFRDDASTTKGSKHYAEMVQDKKAYLQYHAREVAKILYFTDQDPIVGIKTINYVLKNYDGVSAKSGQPPTVTIEYSTQHIEKSYGRSLYTLDYETRGVLFHEMTHAYQYEPKGVGDYGSPDKVFWSFVEGLADAVRIQAGFVDIKERKSGGNWLNGYKTTGFFIHWLTTKDPDAIRKFNASALTLNPWSYNGAMKYIFGEEATITGLWDEYQSFLTK